MTPESRKLSIIFSFLLLLLFITTAFLFRSTETSDEPTPIDSLNDLELITEYKDDVICTTGLWTDDSDGISYIFMPNKNNAKTVRFRDPGKGRILRINGNALDINSDISELFDPEITYTIELVKDNSVLESRQIKICSLADIPVIYLTTDSGNIDSISASKDNEESGFLCIVNADGRPEYNSAISTIRTRGHSSFFSPKKSFILELPGQARLLGNSPAENWILLAQYDEGTKIRTMLATDYMREYTDQLYVDFQYVDVFVNGEYQGLYLFGKSRNSEGLGLTDLRKANIEANSHFNASELATFANEDDTIHAFSLQDNPRDITGGYILEVIDETEYSISFPAFRSLSGIYYSIEAPNNASYEEVTYIKSLIDEAEVAIYSPDGINPVTGKSISDYIDIDKWSDYFLIKEGFADADITVNVSVFISKDSDNKNPLLQPGPVWDLDTLFGVLRPDEYSYITDPEFLNCGLIYSEALISNPEVISVIRKKINENLIPWCVEHMENELYGCYEKMYDSYKADFVRWPESGIGDILSTEDGNAQLMIDFIKRRCEFLRSIFVEEEIWHTVTFMSEGQMVKLYAVKDGEHLKYMPTPGNYIAFFAGWNVSPYSGDSMEDIIVKEDMTFEAMWIYAQWLMESDTESINNVLAQTDIIMINFEELEAFPDAVELCRE